jgi:PhzF family phenazine biosynthesis protein
MKYHHVDVFTDRAMRGNGLAIVLPDRSLDAAAMLDITREFRQFETIFVSPKQDGAYPIRIFTVEEELEFAGHPILGAAAVVHRFLEGGSGSREVRFAAGARVIRVSSEARGALRRVVMNQGKAAFIRTAGPGECRQVLDAAGLVAGQLHPAYPLEVVSTGLSYLLVPVQGCLDTIRITGSGLEAALTALGAKFAYFFDPELMEARTWDNCGRVEDVATGSAAGPLFAYLVKNRFQASGSTIELRQGCRAGRPSLIQGWVAAGTGEVFIQGDVAFFGSGEILAD